MQQQEKRPVQVRIEEDVISRLDDWRSAQRPILTLPEAVRRLMLKSLEVEEAKTAEA